MANNTVNYKLCEFGIEHIEFFSCTYVRRLASLRFDLGNAGQKWCTGGEPHASCILFRLVDGKSNLAALS
jgi:hypothetical protein